MCYGSDRDNHEKQHKLLSPQSEQWQVLPGAEGDSPSDALLTVKINLFISKEINIFIIYRNGNTIALDYVSEARDRRGRCCKICRGPLRIEEGPPPSLPPAPLRGCHPDIPSGRTLLAKASPQVAGPHFPVRICLAELHPQSERRELKLSINCIYRTMDLFVALRFVFTLRPRRITNGTSKEKPNKKYFKTRKKTI